MKLWPTKKLGEVCDFQNGLWTGKKPPFITAKVIRNTNFKNNNGTLNLDDVAEIEVEKNQLDGRILQKGDIILERSGGGPDQPVGRVVYFDADKEFSFSNFTSRIRIKNIKQLDSEYLWRYLGFLYYSGITEKLQKQTTGIRNLMFSEYKELEIPLPPIAEQKKIVASIEKVFAKIDEAARLRAASAELADGLLPSALHEIFSSAKSKGWEEKELGEVIKMETSKNVKLLPYVGMEDIESGTGRFVGSKSPRQVKSTTSHFTTEHVLYGKLRPYLTLNYETPPPFHF